MNHTISGNTPFLPTLTFFQNSSIKPKNFFSFQTQGLNRTSSLNDNKPNYLEVKTAKIQNPIEPEVGSMKCPLRTQYKKAVSNTQPKTLVHMLTAPKTQRSVQVCVCTCTSAWI